MSDDETGRADDRTTVSVLHGSFDSAGFALMIGVYDDEEMSGVERFLDRQFGQLLSGWQDLGHYPGQLGTSIFVEPKCDVPKGSEPAGAHLVGLGSSLTLGPRQLRFAVYRALVGRCLRLYRPPRRTDTGHETNVERVGVSTALLGVRGDTGLRTEDAVTAILEGIGDVNRRLAEYEAARKPKCTVRIGHVQFVERYAHRADLAAVAVRRARLIAALDSGFADLGQVRVDRGDGGLPAGAAVLEQDRSWTRFSVTARATGDESGASVVEVTALGRDARADRVTHQIDRASLDALTKRLSEERSDPDALKALRDRLIPHDLRAEFLGSANLQLVLNEQAAAYSWEQFAAPPSEGDGGAGWAGTGSILRVFAESDDRRLQPVRAVPGTALVVGAGHSTPNADIPAAVAEAKEIGRLLRRSAFEPCVLADDAGSLDVAELNIELLGDHQIVHLAGHGRHVEGDDAASGVLLARDFRFTADFVESMPIVPELVVLNSCHNAAIGLSRLAAGLARTLMRIGVRAVVAAGWPIGDAAAKTFAVTFYEDMLAGRAFGDAVARARRTAAAEHGGDTWAAYQCYGDPTFVLRGRPVGLDAIDDPVSLNDLQTRIETLIVQVADLSRPRAGASSDRRDQLVERLSDLENCAEKYGIGKIPEIRQRLARAARELGEFGRAAKWYSTFADRTENAGKIVVRPAGRTVPVDHLQQAANCLARDAQHRARLGESTASVEPLFRDAEAFAQGALRALADDEGAAILASVYKKWATSATSGREREELLDKAIEAYNRIRNDTRGGYGVENRIQVIAVRDRSAAVTELHTLTDPTPPRGPASNTDEPEGRTLLDIVEPRANDFWARVADGDARLTALMTATTSDEMKEFAAATVGRYLDAFGRRSTFAERYSSIDHLQDLSDLLDDGDERTQFLHDCLKGLDEWRRFAPLEAPIEPAAPTTPTETRSDGSGAAPVQVTALHAACGDCLLLDYTDNTRTPHRILIDGGLESAFDTGLGRELGPPSAPTRVDIAVVTHVDRDHIEGVIRALGEGRLTADQYWFNGRDQITSPDEPTTTRSVRQGDALSRLIPDDKRNRVVHGRALAVDNSGPLELELPGGATAILLSPTRERLAKLLDKWPGPTRDGVEDLNDLLSAFDEKPERGTAEFGQDGSVPNGSSIAFLFEHAGVTVLFTGDAWNSVLVESIEKLLAGRGRTKLAVQLFKLSHHGSSKNITPRLLDLIEPERILICTDGSKYRHPDPETLNLVKKHYPDVPILFTDATDRIRERLSQIGASVPPSLPQVIKLPTGPPPVADLDP